MTKNTNARTQAQTKTKPPLNTQALTPDTKDEIISATSRDIYPKDSYRQNMVDPWNNSYVKEKKVNNTQVQPP